MPCFLCGQFYEGDYVGWCADCVRNAFVDDETRLAVIRAKTAIGLEAIGLSADRIAEVLEVASR
jgi:hypothetical protein